MYKIIYPTSQKCFFPNCIFRSALIHNVLNKHVLRNAIVCLICFKYTSSFKISYKAFKLQMNFTALK